jgi:hypothetical protein
MAIVVAAVFVFFAIFFLAIKPKPRSLDDDGSASQAILPDAIPIRARAIFLAVDATSSGTYSNYGQRYEQRGVFVDLEVPGQAPYERQTTANIPKNLVEAVLPGATMEVELTHRGIDVIGPASGLQIQGPTPIASASPAAITPPWG